MITGQKVIHIVNIYKLFRLIELRKGYFQRLIWLYDTYVINGIEIPAK